MRILYNNLIDDLTTTSLTAYSTATSYTIINVQDERLKKIWKSDTGTSQNIVCELPTFPQYPDSTTGTTALYTFNGTTESFVGTYCSINTSIIPGSMRVTRNDATTDTAYVSKTFSYLSTNKSYYFNIKGSKEGLVQLVNGWATGQSIIITTVSTTWKTVNAVGIGTGTVAGVYLYCNGFTSVGDYIDLDYLYIGDGTYTSTITDNSENNYNLTPVAIATEVVNNEKVLKFNGNNSYCSRTVSDLTGLDGFTIGFDALQSSVSNTATGNKTLFNFGQGLNINGLYCRSINASSLFTIIWNRLGGSEEISAFSLSTTLKNVIITYTYSTKTYTITVDGVTTSGTLTNQIVMPNGLLSLGSYNSTTTFFPGSIGRFKIWGRVLDTNERSNFCNKIPFETENLSLICDYDLDKNYKVNTSALIGHNIKSGTKVKIEANNSNEWGAPAITEYFNYINSEKMLLRFLASTYIYKYWKISFTGQGSIEVGRLWLGDYLQINPNSLDDFNIIKKRNDLVSFGRNRQKFSTPGISWRQFKLSFPRSSSEMIHSIQTMFDTVGNHSSIIFCNLDTSRNYSLVEPVYCVINNNDLDFKHLHKVGMNWEYDLDLEEIL